MNEAHIETPPVVSRDEWNAARSIDSGEYGAVAVRPGASRGRLAPAAFAWRFQKNLPFVPAPLVYQDVFYMVRDGGIITSLDVSTGKLLKEGRTREALGEYYASPVASGGRLYLANLEGKVVVVKATPEWEVESVGTLDEPVFSTPAIAGDRIYIRTPSALYCFAKK